MMDSIVSLLIFAGLFFFMMRFGCGSHKSDKNQTNSNTKLDEHEIDPVCGKPVKMTHGYGKMHEQQLYRFCSRDCLDEFESNQEKYILSKK